MQFSERRPRAFMSSKEKLHLMRNPSKVSSRPSLVSGAFGNASDGRLESTRELVGARLEFHQDLLPRYLIFAWSEVLVELTWDTGRLRVGEGEASCFRSTLRR
jgi:hypothetical protein